MKKPFFVRSLASVMALAILPQSAIGGTGSCPLTGGDPQNPYSLVFTSKEATAALCGCSEYTNPNIPAKKYRTQTLNRTRDECDNFGPVDCSAPTISTGKYAYEDRCEYSGTNFSETNIPIAAVFHNGSISRGSASTSQYNISLLSLGKAANVQTAQFAVAITPSATGTSGHQRRDELRVCSSIR